MDDQNQNNTQQPLNNTPDLGNLSDSSSPAADPSAAGVTPPTQPADSAPSSDVSIGASGLGSAPDPTPAATPTIDVTPTADPTPVVSTPSEPSTPPVVPPTSVTPPAESTPEAGAGPSVGPTPAAN